MTRDLSRTLHALTSRLDRAADAILRTEDGLSYARFLALYMIGREGANTQRALAARLGVSEPSVSRMARVLAQAGWLETIALPGDGNRHKLRLTPGGTEVVERWGGDLEQRLAALVESAGIPYQTYLEHTKRLLTALEEGRR
ncbi:MAG: MarR family transcriptional regulator [Solirubrobacterales bacterium]|nr:MarR family transcriptional regulator [Solirubrobacterales bacterium]